MGSLTDLPQAESPDLILTHPTPDEKRHTWERNWAEWGGGLSLDDYLIREPYLTTIPLAANGGMAHWILTTTTSNSSSAEQDRLVFSSVESLRKRALVTDPETGLVSEEVAYGIGSVYTAEQFRGKRYASRMLGILVERLREAGGVANEGNENGAREKGAVASALWSDIGKQFYGKKGWLAFASRHVTFPFSSESVSVVNGGKEKNGNKEAKPITYENLESFCKLDELVLRAKMASGGKGKARFAFIPDYDAMRWHLYRDDIIARLRQIKDEGRSMVKGAYSGPEGKRVWATWSRSYNKDAQDSKNNTLCILRLGVEDESVPVDELARSFREVMEVAEEEARYWNLGKIELWNPNGVVKDVVDKCGLDHEWVDRDTDSIPSLKWYGKGRTEDVEWVANEKYCWC
ncbi:uncharacterized protein BCR38DRAFT_489647 [Pseudomassariella vexata]|uniref:LYC1 C-terminal domain-containing protein n=1 Tax=Pseudomassariella vexata TaxID=1141098 RepID=A0A1Y2DFV5_9PEZI|nr:uncharacterized protein BCR38DRAFT_489647 [Pseudomassariella vexata]ORY58170.1 hypothetical protein BCR38DRAFT_489647 [Pseudomassariella vexata]